MAESGALSNSLVELVECGSMQWIFVGGKGGVGKTTTACSIAIQMAARRESVLVLSTDPAHNLSDAFSQKFSHEATQVRGFENLYAMEIDSTVRESSAYKVEEGEDDFGLGKLLPDLLSSFPGIDEALSFAELMQAVQTLNYSCIVFDTAPTGHTLRLLAFPNLLEKAFEKFNSLKDSFGGAFDMFGALNGAENGGRGGPPQGITNKLDHMRAVTTSVKEMFRDPCKTTFVCVCIPEFLSVFETERLIQELSRQEIDASYVVVNQILFPIPGADDISLESAEKRLALFDKESSTASSTSSSTSSSSSDKKTDEKLDKDDKEGSAKIDSPRGAYAALLTKCKALESAFVARRKMQSRYLQQIEDLYASDFHVVPMPLQNTEVRGINQLQEFGNLLLQERKLPIVDEA